MPKTESASGMFMKEKTPEFNVTAQLIALHLLIDIGQSNMLLPISMADVTINKRNNNWHIIRQQKQQIETTQQKFSHLLIKDSSGNIVGIIINLPGWMLYQFQIVTTLSFN